MSSEQFVNDVSSRKGIGHVEKVTLKKAESL